MTCPWSPSRHTELSPWKACGTQLSAAPRILISTLGLPHLALPWPPASEFPQTDIPAWPVCSCPKPLEMRDRWDHTWEKKTLLAHLTHCRGKKKKTGSQDRGRRVRDAPGDRFLANLMGLPSSETSAQNTEMSGHAPPLH